MSQNVLIIDDARDIHDLLAVRLRPEGLNLLHAYDADRGMALALSARPDLILLDIDMPEVTGFELCQRLKSDPTTSLVPVIFLTGESNPDVKVRGFDLGAVDFVTKPFHVAELRARVRAALRTKRYQDMLAVRAQIDGMTGLWNRAWFEQRLADEVAAMRRFGRPVSLLLGDIDHFKRVNDTYGHPFGDLVIQRVAEVLSNALRATDAACRYGGEEFAVLLPETDSAGAARFLARLMPLLRGMRLSHHTDAVPVTLSLGLVSTEDFESLDHITSVSLVAAADEALYLAKTAGRDRFCRAAFRPAARAAS